ncbi:unnamed protein product [Amoebophrya sp. A120]|nr:unnamed protein product [Amoebophrya sp. A120]|eukprot:GSA120T00013103001.1
MYDTAGGVVTGICFETRKKLRERWLAERLKRKPEMKKRHPTEFLRKLAVLRQKITKSLDRQAAQQQQQRHDRGRGPPPREDVAAPTSSSAPGVPHTAAASSSAPQLAAAETTPEQTPVKEIRKKQTHHDRQLHRDNGPVEEADPFRKNPFEVSLFGAQDHQEDFSAPARGAPTNNASTTRGPPRGQEDLGGAGKAGDEVRPELPNEQEINLQQDEPQQDQVEQEYIHPVVATSSSEDERTSGLTDVAAFLDEDSEDPDANQVNPCRQYLPTGWQEYVAAQRQKRGKHDPEGKKYTVNDAAKEIAIPNGGCTGREYGEETEESPNFLRKSILEPPDDRDEVVLCRIGVNTVHLDERKRNLILTRNGAEPRTLKKLLFEEEYKLVRWKNIELPQEIYRPSKKPFRMLPISPQPTYATAAAAATDAPPPSKKDGTSRSRHSRGKKAAAPGNNSSRGHHANPNPIDPLPRRESRGGRREGTGAEPGAGRREQHD